MKILKKVALIFSIVVLVLSLGLNVCLFLSSTNRLMLNDNKELRAKLYYNALHNLQNAQNYTLVYETTAPYEEHTSVNIDNMTCTEEAKNSEIPYKCSMISTYYTNGELISTSYYPGDGYKYTVSGGTKTKTSYSNRDLHKDISNVARSLGTYYLDLLIFDSDDSTPPQGSATTSFKFNLKSFSFIKTVNLKDVIPEQGFKASVSLTFDNKDRVTFIQYDDDQGYATKYKISYKSTTFDFPSFDSFGENGGAN